MAGSSPRVSQGEIAQAIESAARLQPRAARASLERRPVVLLRTVSIRWAICVNLSNSMTIA